VQIWANTKPSAGCVGKPDSDGHASFGDPISSGSLYAQILDTIGICYEPNQRLQVHMAEKSADSGAQVDERAVDESPDDGSVVKNLSKCKLPDFAGQIMEQWWSEHKSIAIEKLGWEPAAHVHAAAATMATANFGAGVLSHATAFPLVYVASSHRMALKYVLTDSNDQIHDEDDVIDVEGVLYAWGKPHSGSQLHFAEASMVKHGMYRLRKSGV
jgi:hypothetical protein